jgi:general secretion pathway protein K
MLDQDRNCGFALIVVLWVLVLLGFITTQIAASGRREVRVSRNLYNNAAAEAAVEGGINEALFRLSDTDPGRAWRADGSRHELVLGYSRVELRVENEAGRINPNFASPALMEALLRATRVDDDTARHLATAIAEWVGTPVIGRTPEMVAAEYQAAGRDYAPPGEPMESLNELANVLGTTPEIFAAIRPHLTIYGASTPDAAAADPVVAAALALFTSQGRDPERTTGIVSRRDRPTIVRITASANGPDNAQLVRIAVFQANSAAPQNWTMLAWGVPQD